MKGVVQWRSRMPAKGRLQTYGGPANLFRASMQLLNRTNLNSSSPQLRDPTTQVNVKKNKILVIDRKNQKYEMGDGSWPRPGEYGREEGIMDGKVASLLWRRDISECAEEGAAYIAFIRELQSFMRFKLVGPSV